MTIIDTTHFTEWRPPAPIPRETPLGLISLLKTLKNNPLEAWTRAHFEEPLVSSRILSRQIVVVSEPGAIRRVLLENAANYRKGLLQQRIFSRSLVGGLLIAEGEQWRTQRRTFAPMFSYDAVTGFMPAMLRAADTLTERWSRLDNGAVVDVAADITRTTLDVLAQTIFSDDFGPQSEAIRIAMTDFLNSVGQIDLFDVLGLPDFIPRLSRRKTCSSIEFFDTLIEATIAKRRHLLAIKHSTIPHDLPSLMLQSQDPATGQKMDDAAIKANILTFMSAGHETTANSMTWALFLLSQSEYWSRRLAMEAERELSGPIEGLAERLVETRAVVEEALRLYPPLAAISREAIEPDELAGEPIEAGALIVIAPYVVHRHQRLWTRPDVFDPNRFLPGARKTIPRYAYLPFGTGPRVCIGAAFALYEATLIIATIMKNFRFALCEGHEIWPVQKLTLRPRASLPLLLTKRDRRTIAA